MPAVSEHVPTVPSWTTPRARLAGYKRQERPDSDPDVQAARRELRVALLARSIRQAADVEPPLTGEERRSLTAIIAPPNRGGDE